MKFKKLSRFLFTPRSESEDTRRREFILNVLVLASITLLSIAMVSSVINSFITSAETRSNSAMSLVFVALPLLLCIGLYVLSRLGKIRIASFILVGIFFTLSGYMAYRWGPDVGVGLLFYSLTIVMAGVLLSSRAALIVAFIISIGIPAINILQVNGTIALNSYWRQTSLMVTDAVFFSVVLLFTAIVSWLSNREIEKSLKRARQSEAELKEERDMLEIRVEERTQEWRKAELDNLSQAYRFVEFGRLASGLFHDLMNPLTALSLNIDSIAKTQAGDSQKFSVLGEDVDRAQKATLHMQNLMDSMRRHLLHEKTPQETFRVDYVIEEVVGVLMPYAREHHVVLSFSGMPVTTYGNPGAFTQVCTNLISNAVEAFTPEKKGTRTIFVELSQKEKNIQIDVRDTGSGMTPETLAKVFEPFFTTKEGTRGLGIGLPLARRLIEKEFEGTLSATSTLGEGSVFTIYFPQREP